MMLVPVMAFSGSGELTNIGDVGGHEFGKVWAIHHNMPAVDLFVFADAKGIVVWREDGQYTFRHFWQGDEITNGLVRVYNAGYFRMSYSGSSHGKYFCEMWIDRSVWFPVSGYLVPCNPLDK